MTRDPGDAELGRAARRALAADPRLTSHGYGTFEAPGRSSHAAERAELLARLDAVVRVASWLRDNLGATRGAGRNGSYALKHLYERATGEYVTNGELILAALAAGYPVRPDGPGRPNAAVGVRARDVGRARRRAGLDP
jgi:hypothetical protein